MGSRGPVRGGRGAGPRGAFAGTQPSEHMHLCCRLTTRSRGDHRWACGRRARDLGRGCPSCSSPGPHRVSPAHPGSLGSHSSLTSPFCGFCPHSVASPEGLGVGRRVEEGAAATCSRVWLLAAMEVSSEPGPARGTAGPGWGGRCCHLPTSALRFSTFELQRLSGVAVWAAYGSGLSSAGPEAEQASLALATFSSACG